MSSLGVGELGLHLCYETPATIALRRAAHKDPDCARNLFGPGAGEAAPPMIFTFNPLRTFIEVLQTDVDGFGRMTVSMLDPELPLPLFRYQTGDLVRLLEPAEVAEVVDRHAIALPGDLPSMLLALRGRDSEILPNGASVAAYKDALYANHLVAQRLTGAFRLTFSGAACTMHVQLGDAMTPSPSLEQGIMEAVPARLRPARLVLWPFQRFPYGMNVDYERKFSYYIPGEGAESAS
jgi:phenylacetate-CoA ligase